MDSEDEESTWNLANVITWTFIYVTAAVKRLQFSYIHVYACSASFDIIIYCVASYNISSPI